MKTYIKNKITLLLLGLVSLTSCESFLDMQETEEMTFDKIWEMRNSTEKYLFHVYSFIPDESNTPSTTWIGGADESSCSWSTSGYPFSALNNGSWNVSSPAGDMLGHYYKGAREANVFMQNIDKCTAYDVTTEEKAAWKNEARFLRAYYYAMLLRQFGPVILMKDQVISPDVDVSTLELPRNSWDECVEWVCSELTEVAQTLPSRYEQANYYGKPTNVAAMSIIARLRLTSAREQFNGNALYQNIKNPDGTSLFPAYDAAKWATAAAAGRKAIDLIESGGYKLYKSADGNVYKSLQGIFYEKWNDEMIWSRYIGAGQWANHVRPRAFSGGYGGFGPTQSQVDAYAMNTGIYPIVGYEGEKYFLNQRGAKGVTNRPVGGEPTIDPLSGYTESSFSSWKNPGLQGGAAAAVKPQFDMYKNREPRFYAQIAWNNEPYYQAPNTVIQYHNGGNTGNQHHDHPWTGYMVRKMSNSTVNATSPNWGKFNWPLIRVAEVYLNYCEALVESNPSSPDLLKYWNMVRERAGVPNIGTGKDDVYGEALNDIDLLRELIRRERRIELSFESTRFFDTHQWLISEDTDNAQVYGMNLRAKNSNYTLDGETFWKRSVIQNRVFRKNHYLWPFNQRELDRNVNLTQNYGW